MTLIAPAGSTLRRRTRACLQHALPAIILLVTIAVRADTIRLRNGNAIEGIILQETNTQVVLDLGAGSTTFSRSLIAAVEHASAEENDHLRSDWKHKYYLHRQYTPPDLTSLATEATKLIARHDDALDARRLLEELPARETRLKIERNELHVQMQQTSQQLQQATPSRNNVAAYNALVSANNAQQAHWTTLADQLAACLREATSASTRISAYQDALTACRHHLDEERKKPTDSTSATNRTEFLDRLAQTLTTYEREFNSAEVAVTQSHAGSIVTAVINGETPGRFLVDTGAAHVTMTEAFARRLHLDLTTLPEVELMLADGSKTKGHAATLRVMAVGEAKAENIEAAILPGRPGEQLDGLLGMSFLRHFSVNMDGSSGKLILRQFAPK